MILSGANVKRNLDEQRAASFLKRILIGISLLWPLMVPTNVVFCCKSFIASLKDVNKLSHIAFRPAFR